MSRQILWVVVCCALLAGPAAGQAVYKPVPDVDKAWPISPNDWSCWLAASANVLAGAGYGHAAAMNDQARAMSIYSQLAGDIGTNVAGGFEDAVLYFLYNYGKNPDQPSWYQPDNPYTDMTDVWKSGGLSDTDYNFLLSELQRCQYVAVGLYDPNSQTGHAMTLVGGDFSNNGQSALSVWHDSDWDQGGTDDDFYTSQFTGTGNTWSLAPIPPETWAPAGYAEAYLTLCPGLNKPAAAMNNYDVAWFRDWDPNIGWFANSMRVGGMNAPIYGNPVWLNQREMIIPNQAIPDHRKSVYLLVEYIDRDPNRTGDPLLLKDDMGNLHSPVSVTISPDQSQILYEWDLLYQPLNETVIFPNDGVFEYFNLSEPIKAWDLATMCWRIGDVNEDEWVDPIDIDLLHAWLQAGGPYDACYDIDANGFLDFIDSAMMIRGVFGTEFGDANLDKAVDDADYTIWADNYLSGSSFQDGDFNGDGVVDDADYTLWADNYGFGVVGTTPEPASLALLAAAWGALANFRRRTK